MELSPSFNQENLMVASEAFSFTSLLERGIDCIRQGSYVEGAGFFVFARQQLTPDQAHFAVVIDAFLQSQASYWLAQQSLHLANKHVVKADIELGTRLLALEKLFLSLREKTNTAVQVHETAPSGLIEDDQSQQLPLLPPQLIDVDSNRSYNSNGKPTPLPQSLLKGSDTLAGLNITCFGHFEVKRLDRPIVLCHSRSGQALLRFLVAQAGYRASVDRLMDALWAKDAPEKARRKLQIAVSAARCSLNSGYSCDPGEGYIIYKDQFYQFNPAVTIRTDVDEFMSLWKAGRRASGSESVVLYEKACSLCSGPFLIEDTYADWSSARREQLKQIYVTMCRALADYYLEGRQYEDAAKWTNAILGEDRCDEMAHQRLIHIYTAQGRRSEAFQQYYRCERILSEELGISPMPETMNALHMIQNSADLPLCEKFSGK